MKDAGHAVPAVVLIMQADSMDVVLHTLVTLPERVQHPIFAIGLVTIITAIVPHGV